jgi:hypothetical protein
LIASPQADGVPRYDTESEVWGYGAVEFRAMWERDPTGFADVNPLSGPDPLVPVLEEPEATQAPSPVVSETPGSSSPPSGDPVSSVSPSSVPVATVGSAGVPLWGVGVGAVGVAGLAAVLGAVASGKGRVRA